MAQPVSAAVKAAFEAQTIERQYKLVIDWITGINKAGVITAGQQYPTYMPKEAATNDVFTESPKRPMVLSDSMKLSDSPFFLRSGAEYGWMGNVRSDGSGDFATSEVWQIIFTNPVNVMTITTYGASYSFPVDFEIFYRDTLGAWQSAKVVTGETELTNTFDFGTLTTITGVKVEIDKINKTDMFACLIEVDIGFIDDVSADIVRNSMKIKKESEYEKGTIDVGNISANELTFALDNTSQRYNSGGASVIADFLKANKKVEAFIGVEVAGTVEFIKQGTFFIRDIVPNPGMTVNFDCLDRMGLMNEVDFETSAVKTDKRIDELVVEVVEDFGITSDKYNIDTTVGSIAFTFFEKRKYAFHVKQLTIGEGGKAYFDEDDIFIFRNRDLSFSGTITANEWSPTYGPKGVANNGVDTETALRPFILSSSLKLSDDPWLLRQVEYGWLGNTRSDGAASFGVSQDWQIVYDNVLNANSITVNGVSYSFPVDFDLYYRDESGIWILANSYVANTSINILFTFASNTSITGIKVEITRISEVDMFACLVEVRPSITDKAYTDSNLVFLTPRRPYIARKMKNRVVIKAKPLEETDEKIIYQLEAPVTIRAGETKTIPCWFFFSPSNDVQNAVITKHADISLDTEAQYNYATFLTFTNANAADQEVTAIEIDGKPLVEKGIVLADEKDDDLINEFKEKLLTVENPFIQDYSFARSLAEDLLTRFKNPEAEIVFQAKSMPWLQLGDVISVTYTKFELTTVEYKISSIIINCGDSVLDTIKAIEVVDSSERENIFAESITFIENGSLTSKSITFISGGDALIHEILIFG